LYQSATDKLKNRIICSLVDKNETYKDVIKIT